MKSNEILQTVIDSQKNDISRLKTALQESVLYIEKFKDDLSKNMAEEDIYTLAQEKINNLLIRCNNNKSNLTSDLDSILLQLYSGIENIFQASGKRPPSELSTVLHDSIRINQIETILDLYSEKIAKVSKDKSLDEDEKEEKKDFWRRLRDRDITRLEEA